MKFKRRILKHTCISAHFPDIYFKRNTNKYIQQQQRIKTHNNIYIERFFISISVLLRGVRVLGYWETKNLLVHILHFINVYQFHQSDHFNVII